MNATCANTTETLVLRRIRQILGLFILGLVFSGLTAFPLLQEVELIARARGLAENVNADAVNGFDHWIMVVRDGLRESYARHPWIAYGTDWLAFAHLIIAIFFIGPLIDPIRNVWVLRAGVIACVAVVPLALICGAVRQIPFGWRLIDCSFGVFGIVPLLYCLRLIRKLDRG